MSENTMFLGQMGSVAYGVSNDNSDIDVYGFCIPPKDLVFPHLAGIIPGFGRQQQRFDCWQEHHVKVADWNQEYDFSIYSIVRYFQLCMENNPNMIDSLFIPRRCVLHSTAIYEMVRDCRKLFLHKGAWHKFKGYAYSQMHKMKSATNALTDFMHDKQIPADTTLERVKAEIAQRRAEPADSTLLHLSDAELYDLSQLMATNTMKTNEARRADIVNIGYSTKFAYHLIRLLAEVEQIMVEHDLDLERNRAQLKSIRRGEWTLQQIEEHFAAKERDLETLYTNSTLPHSPDETRIRELLLNCLEHHYGDLSHAVARDHSLEAVLRDFQGLIDRYKGAAR